MDVALQPLHDALAQTLAPDPSLIKQAEAFLKNAQSQPGFGISILNIVSTESVQLAIRQQAAVQFKNHIKYHWVLCGDNDDANIPAIQDPEKEQIKAHITDLMLSAPTLVRAQLSEALTIISGHDFPQRWTGLLPSLIAKMKSNDPSILNGVLATGDSIYQRYRGQYMSDSLNAELKYSQQLVAPLLDVTQRLTQQCTNAASTAAENLPLLLQDAKLALSIFYSLNSPGLTDEFEETLDQWMSCIHTLLTLSAPSVASKDPDRESPLDALKATACKCLSLFMERNEEEFAPHLQTFVSDVWQQLLSVGMSVGQDSLTMAAIAFLTTVARSVHYTLFGEAEVLKQVCEGIVIPNLRLRDEDEELFEMNWLDYVRRDTEGSDNDTRRRAASELVRALVEKFPTQTTELFSGYVTALLNEAAAAPDANWRAKDAAIYLVSALAVRGRTAATGATSTNELVNLNDFYSTHVAPELSAADVDARPVIKADCLRFATTFRSQLPRQATLDLFSKATSLLGSKHNVVHSYAAVLVERLLAMKSAGGPAFNPTELASLLQPLLERLFGALTMPESGENEYVMRAVMRLVTFVGGAIAPVAAAALRQLAEVLLRVARNPTQPGFNHYLFESIAALVGCGAQGDPQAVVEYETVLFPPFQTILQEDVQEFHPYVFQIFAQLVEYRGSNLPQTYLQLLPPLLAPVFWERSGNVPALGRLLRAFIAAAPGEIVSMGQLPAILGVFQKLVASKAHDHEGMLVFDALMLSIHQSAMQQYMTQIWTILFQRLQMARTPKIVRAFTASASLLAAKRGGGAVADSMDTVQPGISTMIAQSVWTSGLAGGAMGNEAKVTAVGSTRFLCESAGMQSVTADAAAGGMLLAILNRVSGGVANVNGAGGAGDDGGGNEEEFAGYAAAYAKLHNAAEKEKDALPEIANYRRDVAQRLAVWSQQQPGRVERILVGAGANAETIAAMQKFISSV